MNLLSRKCKAIVSTIFLLLFSSLCFADWNILNTSHFKEKIGTKFHYEKNPSILYGPHPIFPHFGLKKDYEFQIAIYNLKANTNTTFLFLLDNRIHPMRKVLDIVKVDYSAFKKYSVFSRECRLKGSNSRDIVAVHYDLEELADSDLKIPKNPQMAWLIDLRKEKIIELNPIDVVCPIEFEDGP